MELFRLFGSVMIDDKDAITALKNVDNKANSSASTMDKLSSTGKKVGTIFAAGTAIAGTALVKLAGDTINASGAIQDSADRTAMSAEEYQKWAFAAGQCGMETEALEKAMIKQQKAFADAKSGSTSMSDAYGKLGIDIENVGTSSEAFDLVIAKLAGMTDATERDALANDIFGKSYADLTPMLNEGGAGIDDLKQKAVDLGGVMSNEAVASGEQLGDTLDQVKLAGQGIANSIGSSLMPIIQKLANYLVTNAPAIQATTTKVFDGLGNAIKFVGDNSNIIMPILAAVLVAFAGFKVVGIVTSIIAAWSTVTAIATTVGGAFGAVLAFITSPIGLIVLAIGALIAIGVLLYQNWDKIIAGAQALWNNITSIFTGIATAIGTKAGEILTTVSNVFGKIFSVLSSPFTKAKEFIGGVIDKIKGFLNFKWEFPKLKMPHFTVTGTMNPLKWIDEGIPKLGVDWYAKGGIFSKPTLFNTPYGMKGVGEAGAEVVAPLSDLTSMINNAVQSAMLAMMGSQQQSDEQIVVENVIYFGDEPVYKSVKRAEAKENRRYKTQTIY